MSKHRIVRVKSPELGDFKPMAEQRPSGTRKRPPMAGHDKSPEAAEMPTPPSPRRSHTAPPPTSLPSAPEMSPFQLSRLYAKGWQAGMTHREDSLLELDARGDTLNPCTVAAERARWMQGFSEAVRRKLASPGRKQPQFTSSSQR